MTSQEDPPRRRSQVSIPSESGLFLRSAGRSPTTSPEPSFQSPQNRGYSSDSILTLTSRFASSCFNPLRIGAIPQMRNRSATPRATTERFNPLRIGAIPQIRSIRRSSTKRIMFQSPQNRGYSSDAVVIGIMLAKGVSFNPLRIGAIPQMRASRSPCPRRLRFQSPQNRGYSSDFLVHIILLPDTCFNPLRIGAIPQMPQQVPQA